MPELVPSITSKSNELFQTKLSELKKKLTVEKQMYEAAKLIKVRMNKDKNVQQIENSLKEYEERIRFMEEEVSKIENELEQLISNNYQESISSEYLDAFDSLKISLTPSIVKKSDQTTITNTRQFLLANQKLSWAKIDFKINELSCKLKINENILEAEEKIIQAYKVEKSDEMKRLLERKEISKQKVQVLQQALKKYSSLVSTTGPITLTIAEDNGSSLFGILPSQDQFTGNLLIKVTKLGGFTVGPASNSNFILTFNLNRSLTSSNATDTSNYDSISAVINSPTKDPNNSTIFSCYQELSAKLIKSSELELIISTGSGSSIKGIFSTKLASIFCHGPDEESSISESFEIEPSGIIDLQFHFTPDKLKKNQMNKERIARIERRPVIKRTQHLIKGHELISTNFFQLLKCSYCNEMIMNTSGYQCKLCKLICHRKCYSKLFEKCLYSEKESEEEVTEKDRIIDQFTSNYNIPHCQKLVSVAIPNWCAHCGHILPLGRKINYKCGECSIMWHDRCDLHISKNHCGLNSTIIETYLETMENVKKNQEIRRNSTTISKTPISKSKESINTLKSNQSSLRNRKLRIEDFELIKCLGKGNFGKVMLAKYTGNSGSLISDYFAIKMLKKQSIVDNEEYQSLKTEKRIFELATQENNPFLVQLETIFQDEFRIYFVMEFINGGDLMYHIQNRPFNLMDCKFYAAQVVIALEFLHSKGILYRDLKLDNILLTKDGNIKLADYGLSKCDMTQGTRTKTFCGTPEFMAPELLLDLPYGFSVDFWAFGVLLYQMLESRSPFYGNNEKETFSSILKCKLVFSSEIDKQGKSLISKLLTPKPTERLGIKDSEGWNAIKNHAFFSDINWTALKDLRLPVPFKPTFTNDEDVSNFDEIFTSEDIALTPYPSFTLRQNGSALFPEASIFADF